MTLDEIRRYRKKRVKDNWSNIGFVILFLSSLVAVILGVLYQGTITSDFYFLEKVAYYNLISAGLYLIFIRETIIEWKEKRLISHIFLPLGILIITILKPMRTYYTIEIIPQIMIISFLLFYSGSVDIIRYKISNYYIKRGQH